jgi:hypothetical protein
VISLLLEPDLVEHVEGGFMELAKLGQLNVELLELVWPTLSAGLGPGISGYS